MLNTVLLNPHLEGESFLWEAGPTGVFLSHGFTATTAEVRLLAQRLYAHGYSVAGPLLPGHGTTPDDLNRTRWQDWVRAGEQTYQQLAARCERVFVGGESMGAVLALYLASTHPEAVAVLAYAPAIKLARSRFNILQGYLASFFIASVPKKNAGDNPNWQGYPVHPLKGFVQLLALQRHVLGCLPLLRQPVLVVQGRLDPTIHPDSGQVICRRVSSAVKEIHWLEHSTHVVILENELDQITQLTLDFMQRALGGRSA